MYEATRMFVIPNDLYGSVAVGDGLEMFATRDDRVPLSSWDFCRPDVVRLVLQLCDENCAGRPRIFRLCFSRAFCTESSRPSSSGNVPHVFSRFFRSVLRLQQRLQSVFLLQEAQFFRGERLRRQNAALETWQLRLNSLLLPNVDGATSNDREHVESWNEGGSLRALSAQRFHVVRARRGRVEVGVGDAARTVFKRTGTGRSVHEDGGFGLRSLLEKKFSLLIEFHVVTPP